MVEIQNVRKVYNHNSFKIEALKEIILKVEEGEFLVLMGPSGSGKTTLLNLIGGVDSPTSGRVIIDSIDIGQMSENEIAKWRTSNIGFIFQLYNLIPVLTAYENVELPMLLLNLSKEDRKKHTLTALKIVGLEDRIHHYPRELSGGQEQRVGIARAIVTDPKIILADEPTGNLDSESGNEILNLLSELNNRFNKTIIMVTHDSKAVKYASCIKYLEKGIMIEKGGKEDEIPSVNL